MSDSNHSKNNEQNRLKGVFLVLLSAIFFGLMGPFAVIAKADGLSQSSMLLYRFFVSFLILFIWASSKGHLKGLTIRKVLPAFLMGAIAYFLQSYFYFSSIDHIGVGLSSIILYVYPAVVVLLLWAFKSQKPSIKLWIGIITAFVGVALCFIEGSQSNSDGNTSMLGIYLAIAAAFVYSSYLVIGEGVLTKLSPLVTTTFVSLGASCSYLVKILLQENFTLPASINGYLALGAFTLLSSVLAMLFIFEGIKLIGSAKASVLSSIEPVTAVLIGTLFMSESFSTMKMLGFALVMFSVIYISTERN